MPRIPTRPPQGARLGSGPGDSQRRSRQSAGGARSTGGFASGPGSAPRLKVLLAGVDKDTRALVEREVARALASRDAGESWTVSLVRIAGKWSVTLDGPEPRFRNLSFTADDDRLAEAIRSAIGAPAGGGGAGAFAPAEPARRFTPSPAVLAAGEAREALVCEDCQQRFVVIYEAQAGESKMLTTVACPHCWHINHVEIGSWAASGRDYRAEKA